MLLGRREGKDGCDSRFSGFPINTGLNIKYRITVDHGKLMEGGGIDSIPCIETENLKKEQIQSYYYDGMGIVYQKAGEGWMY